MSWRGEICTKRRILLGIFPPIYIAVAAFLFHLVNGPLSKLALIFDVGFRAPTPNLSHRNSFYPDTTLFLYLALSFIANFPTYLGRGKKNFPRIMGKL